MVVFLWEQFPDGAVEPLFTPSGSVHVLFVEASAKEFDANGDQNEPADRAAIKRHHLLVFGKNHVTDPIGQNPVPVIVHNPGLLVNGNAVAEEYIQLDRLMYAGPFTRGNILFPELVEIEQRVLSGNGREVDIGLS